MKKIDYKTTIRLDGKMKTLLDNVFCYSHHHTKSELIRHALFIGLQQIRKKNKVNYNPTTKTTEEKP